MYGLILLTKLNDTSVPENNGTATDPYLKPLGQVCCGTQRLLDFRKARQYKSHLFVMFSVGFGGNTLS